MYENQGTAAAGNLQNLGQYGATKMAQPDLPLLDYATQEIQRLSAAIAAQVREVNSFVDGVRGPIPTLLGSATDGAANKPLPPPNRGEALREAIRNLQLICSAGDEAVKRLGGI